MIWNARNQLLFESRHTSPWKVVTKAVASAKEWAWAQSDSKPPNDQNKAPTRSLSPKIPIETVLCNTDAAWNPSTKETGLGWIFIAPNAPPQQGFQFQPDVKSPLLAEGLAIRSALSHAIHLSYTRVWIRSDSLGLIRAIVSKEKLKNFYGVLSDIETLSRSLNFCFFHFYP